MSLSLARSRVAGPPPSHSAQLKGEKVQIEVALECEQERILNSMGRAVQSLLSERERLKRENLKLRELAGRTSMSVSRSVSPAASPRNNASAASSPGTSRPPSRSASERGHVGPVPLMAPVPAQSLMAGVAVGVAAAAVAAAAVAAATTPPPSAGVAVTAGAPRPPAAAAP